MSVNLQKGQKVDLTKGNAGLRRVMVGLGWDAAVSSGFFGGRTQDIDCDAIAFLLNSKGNIESSSDVVFFNNLNHQSGCVFHQGDNLTGEGEGDEAEDECESHDASSVCDDGAGLRPQGRFGRRR